MLDSKNEYNKQNYKNSERYVTFIADTKNTKNRIICILSNRTPLEIESAIEENKFIENLDRISKLELKQKIQVRYQSYIIEKQEKIIENLMNKINESEKRKKLFKNKKRNA